MNQQTTKPFNQLEKYLLSLPDRTIPKSFLQSYIF